MRVETYIYIRPVLVARDFYLKRKIIIIYN